jgi:predicted PolB exonuclease-like 3'-5' exonuclease
MRPLVIFDIETVPDYSAVARAHRLDVSDVEAAKAIIGEDFPPAPYHRIVCIGALVAVYDDDRIWRVQELKAFHAGEMDEKQIIEQFVTMIDFSGPTLVSYNGLDFDLPVIQSRALLHKVPGKHLTRAGKYFNRYGEFHIDLCNEFSNFSSRNRVKLDELCRVVEVDGKIADMDGSRVSDKAAIGDFSAIARYCVRDVAATYRLMLLRELFHNRVSEETLQASLDSLSEQLALFDGTDVAPEA